MSVETPGSPQPTITTPPDELVSEMRVKILPYMDKITTISEEALDVADASNEHRAEAAKRSAASADFMRTRFPHLDDVTLSALCAYVATNLFGAVVADALCPDSLKAVIVFAEQAKTLGWSLGTPDGVGCD